MKGFNAGTFKNLGRDFPWSNSPWGKTRILPVSGSGQGLLADWVACKKGADSEVWLGTCVRPKPVVFAAFPSLVLRVILMLGQSRIEALSPFRFSHRCLAVSVVLFILLSHGSRSIPAGDPPRRQQFTVHVPVKALIEESAPGTLRIHATQPVSVKVRTATSRNAWTLRSSADLSTHTILVNSTSPDGRLVVTIAAP